VPDQTTSKQRCCTAALSLSLAAACVLQIPLSVRATDVQDSQHVYVPPSLYERRIEFNNTREKQAVNLNNSGTSANHHKLTPAGNGTFKPASQHPYGTLPSPPNTSASLGKSAKDLQEQLRQAAASPKVQAALKELKAQAENYARSGKLAEAKHAVAEALQLTPQDKALLRQLGTISLQRAKQLMQTTDLTSATQFARQALAFDAANSDARKVLDGLLQKEGINPSDPQARLKAADLLAARGHNDEAWVEYQAVNQLKPSAEAHVGMGNLSLRAGDQNRAKQEYLHAEELSPNSSIVHRQIGMLKMNAGDIVGANAELSRAVTLDPTEQGASKALVELWQNQVSKVPGANSHLGLARAYQLSGNLQSAQSEYRTVVQMDPENPHLPAARQSFKLALARQESEQAAQAAHTLESQGALPEAYQKLEEAIHINPGDSDLHVHEGYLLEKMHQYAAAHDAYMQALKLNPHNLLAASRIKNLPAVGSSALGSGQPVFSPQGYSGANGAVSTGSAGTGDQAAAQSSHVNSLSNFAYSLRNHMVTNKAAMQQVEDQTQSAISGIANPGQSLLGIPASQTAGSAAAVGGGAAALSAVPASNPLSNSVSSALANARAALAAAHGGPAVATGSFPSSHIGSVTGATSSNSGQISPLPPTASRFSSTSPTAPTASSIQTGNESAFDSAALALPEASTRSSAPHTMGVEPLQAPPYASSPAYVPPTTSALGFAPYAPPSLNTASGSAADPNMPALRGTLPVNGRSNAFPSTSGVSSANVKFELVNASPKVKDVELSVVLKNDGDTALLIPRNAHGVIRYNNRQDASVKVVFSSSAVAPHSLTHGTIHVPYSEADPSADLVLPGLLPADSGNPDLHLTTSVALR
jgi:tetratricopeptide (TPR) repeat protein